MKRKILLILFMFFCLINYKIISKDEDYLGDIEKNISDIKDKIINFRREMHSDPELSNREFRTMERVAGYLTSIGIKYTKGIANTGVVALIEGKFHGKTVAIRGDMDALPIQEENDLPFKSKNPNVMHACGHDIHTSVALGTVEVLNRMKNRIKGNVKIIFQPAEEGAPEGEEGGADLMVKQGVLDNPRPEAIFALHVNPDLETGKIGFTPGSAMANSDGFEIIIYGKKSHGAYPHLGIDAIYISAQFITSIQAIISRELDILDPSAVTVGIIEGGVRSNIIADRVKMIGTIRTLSKKHRQKVPELIERILKGVTESYGGTYKFNYREGVPMLYNNPELTEWAAGIARNIIGEKNVIQLKPQLGAEDFSFFAQKIPGVLFWLGVRNEKKGYIYPLHTSKFIAEEDSIFIGIKLMSNFVINYLKKK
ncbi:MAG: M20 family metallopeptidase [Acidobacteriota bacterium]